MGERGIQTLHEGATQRLHEYWVHGAGAAKIGWGTPGDFDRCVTLLSQYITDAKGYCNLAHHSALGFYPATHAKMEGKHRDAALPVFTADDLEWLHSQMALTERGLDEREHLRAQLAASAINDLPDSDFAYIEPGGSKDSSGRTVPRSLRHFPIHDAAHVRDALARAPQSPFGDKAMPAIRAAAKRMGIGDETQRFNKFHAPAGSSTGGQFTTGGSGGGGKKPHGGAPAKGHAHGGSSGHHRPAAVHIPHGAMGYDPASNTGTGYGSKNGDTRVHQLQEALNRLGLTDMHNQKLKDDGKLGPRTTASVKKAQRALGLKVDGIVTPALLAKLKATKALPKAPKRSAMLEICVRSFDFEFESRAAGGDGRTLEGYAAVFNSPTRIRDLKGDFDETILPGAFKRSLEERTPVLQFDHGKDPRIGGVPIGSIDHLAEDSQGLHVRATLYDHPDVERVRQAIAGQSIKGMSFRFGVPDGGDRWSSRGGVDQREIRDADVHELGPVVFPAYDTTSVSVRSLLAQLDPDEYRSLVHELAAELRGAVDLADFTGRSAWDADGGDSDAPPDDGPSPNQIRQRAADHDALRLRGIL